MTTAVTRQSRLGAPSGFGQDGATGSLTFRHADVTGRLIPFLSDHDWGAWSATEAGLVLEGREGLVDVRELTITGTGVAPYPSSTRIVPTSPISIGVGERHDVAARPW